MYHDCIMIVSKQKLNELLNSDKDMHVVGRALVHLRNRQTSDEQSSEATKHLNNRGFTPADARMGTSMANFYARRGYLSSAQIAYWKVRNKKGTMRLEKYWSQLNEEAEKKAAK